jgi:hypothetical protein
VLEYVSAERLVVDPDRGLRHPPARSARAKLEATVAGARPCRGGPAGPGGHREGETMTAKDSDR